VAVPIEQRNESAGVLLVGLPKQRANLETLERLRWRCEMAGEVFEREQRIQADMMDRLWQKALLESREAAEVLLDRQGLVVGMSKGAQEFLRGENGLFTGTHKITRFAELFLPQHWEDVQRWLDGGGKNSENCEELGRVLNGERAWCCGDWRWVGRSSRRRCWSG
jgi:PAS domain-containing protein